MANVLRMDFYRLFKSKLFYLLIGVTAIFTIYLMAMYAFLDFSMTELDAVLDAETTSLIAGILPQTLEQYMQTFFIGNFLIVFIIIFAVIFCSAEYKSGYVKNTAAHTSPRYVTYFSKLIITVIMTTILFVLVAGIAIGGCAIMGHLELGEKVKWYDVFLMIFINYLSNISLTSIFIMIFYLMRSATPAMISGLVYTMMGTMLFSLINIVIAAAFNTTDFDITKYTNLGNMSGHIYIGCETGDYIRSIVVSIVFLAISSVVSCISLKKRDIR